jgi:hypothetical protein
MENMEKITWRIWESEGIGKSVLIGGILFYIPVINLLLLGYYGCWVRKLVLRQGMALPEWRDGRAIVLEAARVIGPFAAWVLLPILLAGLLVWALVGLLVFLHMGIFAGTLAWLPLALVALLSPPAFTVSLIRLYKGPGLREAFQIPEILHEVVHHLKDCLFPLLQFYGILALGWPLIGFASFLAVLPLLAQLILITRNATDSLNSGEF